MVILMGKGSIEAKYGLIGLKGLKLIILPILFSSPIKSLPNPFPTSPQSRHQNVRRQAQVQEQVNIITIRAYGL